MGVSFLTILSYNFKKLAALSRAQKKKTLTSLNFLHGYVVVVVVVA